MSLSLTMIAKDEAPRIAKALESARKVCDELIVVDTGSTDGTQSIAVAMGARVIPFEWCDDFSAARNFALDQATADWCLFLDADDAIDDENAAKINALVPTLTSRHDAVFMPYQYAWRGDFCVREVNVQRLIRRTSIAPDGNPRRWVRRLHEYFDLTGAEVLIAPRIAIRHSDSGKTRTDTGRNRRILELSIVEGDTSARTLWYLAAELQRDGERDRAMAMYAAVVDHPDALTFERYDSLVAMFDAAVAAGDVGAGVAMTERMIAVDPERPDAYIYRGVMASDGGSHEYAIAMLEKAAALRPPRDGLINNDLYTWILRERLARAYLLAGNARAAITNARAAINGHPDPDAMEALAAEAESLIATLT